MARWYGSSTERGYGAQHVKERNRRIALYRPGDICAMGGEPLFLDPKLLDVPHDHVNGGYLPGLSCRKHNRQEGAARGNQLRGFVLAAATVKGQNTRCAICGQPYTRAARSCEMCLAHYHPTYGQQRTCSRTCGTALRRRIGNLGAGGRSQRQPRPACAICGKPCTELHGTYCSKRCAGEARTLQREEWPSTAIAYYHCRYCGQLSIRLANSRQTREVCTADICQRARIVSTKLRLRRGYTAERAEATVTESVRAGIRPSENWQSARLW